MQCCIQRPKSSQNGFNMHCVTGGSVFFPSYMEDVLLSLVKQSMADALTSLHWFCRKKCVCVCLYMGVCAGVMCRQLAAEIIRTQLFCCPCRPLIQLLSSNIGQLWQSPQHGHWSALLALSYSKYEVKLMHKHADWYPLSCASTSMARGTCSR